MAEDVLRRGSAAPISAVAPGSPFVHLLRSFDVRIKGQRDDMLA